MSTSRVSRVLAGLVAASFSTFVALLSHVSGGGVVPGVVGVVLPLVLSVLVCVALAGRRLGLVRLSLSVVISQVLFHTLFVLGASGGVSATDQASHHGSVALTTAGPPDHAAGHTSPVMWVAHVVAASATIAALRHADVILSRLGDIARFVADFVARLTLVLIPAASGPTRAPLARVVRRVRAATRSVGTISRRGPPPLSIA
ncbi:hypothetical protein [Labedella endophytica]|uniref:Uncharacterized protein n=1 Tax=Labedella endophytica TaxID=1523160 RepID=A0A3S0XKK3_9MICO|nr:hypothetical protein [Labedella endophytica]RUQ98117.1 hypothetical protein ELQ94_13905 [Labedella endophytica]